MVGAGRCGDGVSGKGGGDGGERPESYAISLLAEGKCRAAFAATSEFGSPEVYAPHFVRAGHQLWRAGQVAKAREALVLATQLHPGHAPAWLTLGMVHLSQEDLSGGDRCLARAIALDPGSAPAHYLRGVVARKQGMVAEVIEHFVRAVEADPTYRPPADDLEGLLQALGAGEGRRQAAALRHREAIAPMAPALRARARQALALAQRAARERPARPTLSVCLITRNEAASLPRCLSSVRPIADQIVVVDTGSSDNTIAIARRFGAEVHRFPWRDDFAAARNAAISHATSDWILIMDADEELPPESATELQELLAHSPPGPVCQLLTHAPTAGSGRFGLDLVGHLRMFRNHLGLHFRGAIHEQLYQASGRLVDAAVSTGILVHHHGYLESPESMAERSERNLRLITAQCQAHPDSGYLLFHLGHAYLGCGRLEEAAAALRQSVSLADADSAFGPKASVLLAGALRLLGRPEEAEAAVTAALRAHPYHPELLCALGRSLEEQGESGKAISAYRAATHGRFGANSDYHDFSTRDVVPRERLATILLSAGEARAALEELLAGLAVRPEAVELRHLLASAYLALGQHEEARRELETALLQNPADARARNALAVTHALQGQHQEAARHFEMALASRPDDPEVLCNLGTTRQALGELEVARDCFEEALKHRPDHVTAWLGLARAYLDRGVYTASVRCYQMAGQISDYAPQVMAEIAAARERLLALVPRKMQRGDE